MNVLNAMNNSELFNTQKVNMRIKFGIGRALSETEINEFFHKLADSKEYRIVNSRAEYPPEDSVVFMLNYLESIAISILKGDLDEDMVRLQLEATFKSAVKRFWPILIETLWVCEFGDTPSEPNCMYSALYKITQMWGMKADDVSALYKNAPKYLITRRMGEAPRIHPVPSQAP